MATSAASTSPRYDNSTSAPGGPSGRIASIDIVRGLAMVLMAIDHVRVYSGQPAGGPTPGIFFTRWITHFVAPAFVFFAGTAAFLHGRKLVDTTALSRFLLTRGAWLILLELTVIRLSWTFNADFAHYMIAGVIWMIGWCMILLAAAVHLPMRAIGVIGWGIIILHNAFGGMISGLLNGPLHAPWLAAIVYDGGPVGNTPLGVLFVLIPWIGVMMAGYHFGQQMIRPQPERISYCLRLGTTLTLSFMILRGVDIYGDPRHWRPDGPAPVYLRFLGTSKYPASLLFLLMTLGPMIALVGLAERWKGRVAGWLEVFGRVPMFYYLLHIPVIHAAACVVSLVREGRVNPWLLGNHPLAPPPLPEGYRWSLALLYLVFAICVVVLYFPSAWYAKQRATRKSAWLSYL